VKTLKNQRRDSRLVEVTLLGYFLGLSCRKTMAMLQKEYGTILSSSGVSRVLKVLDERKREFHSREILKYYRFIWMDGMYVKVRSLGKYW
jgi:transposase-like protein